jgi:hypothetical protein
MARPNPIIHPVNVHLDAAPVAPLQGSAGLVKSAAATRDGPERVAYNFGGAFAIVLQADIQVGLHAKSDRPLCDLELMQFVTPREFEEIYVGIKGGHSKYFFSASIENKLFLDGHSAKGSLVHENAPWMSRDRAEHFAPNTRDGHFKNFCEDTPGGHAATWIVVSHDDPTFNGEKHFLWRIVRRDEFMTFAVFVHPSGERQPIALAKWTCVHNYRLKWTKKGNSPEIPDVRSGRSAIVMNGGVTTNAADLAAHVAKVKSPPDWIHPHANPHLIDMFAALGATGTSHYHSPLDHPEVEADFFTVMK